jgi:hypothetical protein
MELVEIIVSYVELIKTIHNLKFIKEYLCKLIIAFIVNIFTIINKNIPKLVELKKLFSILLTVLLILNSAGYVIVYFQLKSNFKADASLKLENIINKENLTTIVLSRYEFENENINYHFVEPLEIKYFGKLYDVSFIEYSIDSVKIVALSDENEDNLNSLFEFFFTRNLNDIYSDTESLNGSIIIDSDLPVEFNGISPRKEVVCNNLIFVPLLKSFHDVPTPPPKYSS